MSNLNKEKKYTSTELGRILYSIADHFVADGMVNNTETQNIVIPTVFLKRIFDLREDYILNKLVKDDLFELNDGDYIETMRNLDSTINKAYKVKNDDEWFFVTYQDILDFNYNNQDNEELEISLNINNEIKLKTTAANKAEFIKEIYNNMKNETVKAIFHSSRYFDHYLDDRRKTKLTDIDVLFNKLANEHFGKNINTDLFSHAYIYMISVFASNAGKKGGEFFTPDDICKSVVACLDPKMNKIGRTNVCDITSGSATFLIEFGNYIKEHEGEEKLKQLDIFLQEKEEQTLVLGEAGLLLSGLENIKAYHANTLTDYKDNIGQHRGTMDYLVGNPPYGVKILDKSTYEIVKMQNEERWSYGVPPKAQVEWLFVQTSLDMLKENGKAGIVLPLGVLFKDNSKTQMLNEDIIEGVIQLPGNMFQTTGIPTCIIIFNKDKKEEDKNKVFMVNTSDFAWQDGKYNTIDYEKLINTYVNRIEEDGYSQNISLDLIKENDYNLSVQRYVYKEEPEEVIDIEAVMAESAKLEAEIAEKKAILDDAFAQIIKLRG